MSTLSVEGPLQVEMFKFIRLDAGEPGILRMFKL